jgi:ADP-heptose:LPS heptosyltransferase
VGVDPVYDVDLPVARGSVHQVDRLLDLVRWLGADATRDATAPTLALRPEDRERGRAALGERALGGPRIGLHPAAANPLKCWPVEHFATLGEHLARSSEARLFVLDTPKEPGPAQALVAALGTRGIAATLVAPQPLGAFAGACAELDLVCCNDSGVMHVAAAVGTAVLSFHSLGDPAEWAPRVPGRARALHAERIERIAAAEAVAAAIALLAEPSR